MAECGAEMERVPDIREQMELLDVAVCQQSEVVAELATRLESLMRPPVPEKKGEGVPEMLCPFAATIRGLRENLQGTTHVLGDLLRRLEL